MKQILTLVLLVIVTVAQAQNDYQLSKVMDNEICIDAFYKVLKGGDQDILKINPTPNQTLEIRLEGTSDIKIITKSGALFLHEIHKLRVDSPTVIYVQNTSKRKIKVAVSIMAISS